MAHRILVVEDNPITLKMMIVALKAAGYDAVGAKDGQSALASVAQQWPDLVLQDLVLPDIDGLELAHQLRESPHGQEVILVALSGLAGKLEEARTVSAGFAHLLFKPVEPSMLVALIGGLLQRSHTPPSVPAAVSKSKSRAAERAADYGARVARHLRRQAALNQSLAREASTKAAQLSIMTAVANVVAQGRDLQTVLQDVLARTLDMAGVSMGAIYLVEPDRRVRLACQVGYPIAASVRLGDFFGRPALLEEALAAEHPITVPGHSESATGSTIDVSDRLPCTLLPLVAAGDRIGVLLMASARGDLSEDWVAIASVVGVQIAQAVALARSMARLSESDERHRSLFNRVPVGLYRAAPDGQILDANPAMAQLLGYPDLVSLLHANLHALYVRTEDRPRWQAIRPRPDSPVRNLDVQVRRFDGTMIWVRENTRVVRGPGSSIQYYEGSLENITEQRQAEEGRLRAEEQLRQAQKMEAIGRLAGGIAHDFNNLLCAIMSYADFLHEDLPDGDPRREDVLEISAAATRAAGLTRQLLAFSRQQVLEPRVLNLNEVVAGVDKMLRRIIGEDIALETRLDPELGPIKADPGQLEQVIMNLAVNARDAMPKGGRLTLETAEIDVDDAYVATHGMGAPGRYAMLAVSDTGCGMDGATQARIFEPFFTTKEKGKGTGLGLSTVYGIVQQSGGFISVYSEPDRGAVFKVYLRYSDEVVEGGTRGNAPSQSVGGTETILFVEDEAALRKVGRTILARQGYTVLTAASGDEALAIGQHYRGVIDLIATDVVMPGISGRELVCELLGSFPNAKVLFMSGYASAAVAHEGILEPGAAFLQKPFSAAALTRKVRDVLDGVR